MRRVVQKAIIQVVQRQIVEYTCDDCGSVCGTRANPKETWYGRNGDKHYCKKTCGPHARPERERILRALAGEDHR